MADKKEQKKPEPNPYQMKQEVEGLLKDVSRSNSAIDEMFSSINSIEGSLSLLVVGIRKIEERLDINERKINKVSGRLGV